MFEIVLYVVLVGVALQIGLVWWSALDYATQRLEAWWEDGLKVTVHVKAKRFLWPSRNVTFWRVIFDGGPEGLNDPTLRHELQHVRQYEGRGWWWVWTHRSESEAEARSVERAEYPKWRAV